MGRNLVATAFTTKDERLGKRTQTQLQPIKAVVSGEDMSALLFAKMYQLHKMRGQSV